MRSDRRAAVSVAVFSRFAIYANVVRRTNVIAFQTSIDDGPSQSANIADRRVIWYRMLQLCLPFLSIEGLAPAIVFTVLRRAEGLPNFANPVGRRYLHV